MYLDGKQLYFIGGVLLQVGETVVRRCFVGWGASGRFVTTVATAGVVIHVAIDPLAAGRCRVPKSDPCSRSCVLHCYCRPKI